jgi:hypothetical protein
METKTDYAGQFAALLNEKFKGESEFSLKVFSVTRGRKFDRVVQESPTGNGRSVHAFVDVCTGQVFKAAGWKAPAKGARYATIEDAAEAADVYGGYLYAR